MAHFAELESKIDPTGFTSDTLQVVKRVVVVGNDVQTFFKVEVGNKLHIIIILENNMLELILPIIPQRINF